MILLRRVFTSLVAPVVLAAMFNAPQNPPLFTASTDIGSAQQGSTVVDPATGAYRVSGGGEDVWGTADGFRFTWTKFSGHGSLTADVAVTQPGTHPKAKGMLMFRQSLDPGSPYADVALHADGHMDLQWRTAPGGDTKDTDLPGHNAVRLRLERHGNRFTAYALTPGDTGKGEPSSISIPMQDPVYVGVGVCSHSTSALQTVTFSDLQLDHVTYVTKSHSDR